MDRFGRCGLTVSGWMIALDLLLMPMLYRGSCSGYCRSRYKGERSVGYTRSTSNISQTLGCHTPCRNHLRVSEDLCFTHGNVRMRLINLATLLRFLHPWPHNHLWHLFSLRASTPSDDAVRSRNHARQLAMACHTSVIRPGALTSSRSTLVVAELDANPSLFESIPLVEFRNGRPRDDSSAFIDVFCSSAISLLCCSYELDGEETKTSLRWQCSSHGKELSWQCGSGLPGSAFACTASVSGYADDGPSRLQL